MKNKKHSVSNAGLNVRLSPLEIADIPMIHAWQNSPAIRDLTMGFRFPVQMKSVEDWLHSVRESNSFSRVVFSIKENDKTVGIIQLNAIDWVHRRANLGVYIGEKSQGSGLGKVACSLLIDYAFSGLNLEKVGLEVLANHKKARKLYEGLSFGLEGTKIKEYFLDGKREDVCVYGLMKANWKNKLPEGSHRLIHGLQG